MLNWSKQFNIFCLLDHNGYDSSAAEFECMLAVGVKRSVTVHEGESLHKLQTFIDAYPAWMFGHLSYDLKNQFEQLPHPRPNGQGFAQSFFFEPLILIEMHETVVHVHTESVEQAKSILSELMACDETMSEESHTSPKFSPALHKQEYIQKVKEIIDAIQKGECYELNFCNQYSASVNAFDPFYIFSRLNLSPVPFAVLYRVQDAYCISASPERFLKKQGDSILAQPIKGTSRRNLDNPVIDQQNKLSLAESAKERSENVMVVDLVRNDLSKVCEPGSVYVEELFGLYTFPTVHQMISTVAGTLKKDVLFTEIIAATFPMGSMTGAPKKRVMELINDLEPASRGLFSGSIGYISPEGNFDFNVVIRSIFYNAALHTASYYAGGAITFYSEPEKEWEECKLKTQAVEVAMGLRQ